MPHITLECTDNVKLDYRKFFSELAEELVATGHASKMGIKCRMVSSEKYYIIDGNPDYQMVNLLFRLREGRNREVLEKFSTIGILLLEKYLEKEIESKNIVISTEVKELVKGLDQTKNFIR